MGGSFDVDEVLALPMPKIMEWAWHLSQQGKEAQTAASSSPNKKHVIRAEDPADMQEILARLYGK